MERGLQLQFDTYNVFFQYISTTQSNMLNINKRERRCPNETKKRSKAIECDQMENHLYVFYRDDTILLLILKVM